MRRNRFPAVIHSFLSSGVGGGEGRGLCSAPVLESTSPTQRRSPPPLFSSRIGIHKSDAATQPPSPPTIFRPCDETLFWRANRNISTLSWPSTPNGCATRRLQAPSCEGGEARACVRPSPIDRQHMMGPFNAVSDKHRCRNPCHARVSFGLSVFNRVNPAPVDRSPRPRYPPPALLCRCPRSLQRWLSHWRSLPSVRPALSPRRTQRLRAITRVSTRTKTSSSG